jgi:pseudolysin
MYFHTKFTLTALALLISTQSLSAELIDLKDHNNSMLSRFMSNGLQKTPSSEQIKEISRFVDRNGVTHIRVQEYYNNYPVWDGQAVIHAPHLDARKKSLLEITNNNSSDQSMNGHLYQGLDADLRNSMKTLSSGVQSQRAIEVASEAFLSQQNDQSHRTIQHTEIEKLVFINSKQQARWAYKVRLEVPSPEVGILPAKPVYIIDAENFKIYQHWDEIKTEHSKTEYVTGGGFGGNPNIGQLIYDDSQDHLAAFPIRRQNQTCYLENNEIVVSNMITNKVMQFPCLDQDPEHNNVFWSGDFDQINQGYSPANDAMFAARVIKQFYREWYDVPALVKPDGSDMVLQMLVHAPKLDNAYWNGQQMVFGDGNSLYPLTSLGVAAHEVSHGFTQQHSDLVYEGESGGMNEAFSDMAAQTAEYYGYGKSSWMIGAEIFKVSDEALRYMDQPSKDCYGKEPGSNCSIDRSDEYYDGLDVHHSSGVYNRAFYLLSTTPGWDTRKAFAVMLQANAGYWLSNTQFADGAGCAVQAADDLHFDRQAVRQAFEAVGIKVPKKCTNKG